MKDPLISVIIPSFDRPFFLRTRSIPSLIRQNYSNWDLIVVGDGPKDDSVKSAVESFNDPRMKYVEIPRPDYSNLSREQFWNVAGGAARNYALCLAQGGIIAPLDDDDEFLENHLSDCVQILERNEADLVYGSVIVRDIETGVEHEDFFPWTLENQALFETRNIMYHSSVCYSRRFAGLRYPLDGQLAADYGLWLSILHSGGRFASISRPQSIYYGDNLTASIRVTIPSLSSREQLYRSIDDIFHSRILSNSGPWCQRFERAVANYLGVTEAISSPSGDVALIMAFCALKQLQPNRSEIILPSYTFPSTVNAILWNGLQPVFCDIDFKTLCITPETVEPLISSNTSAILPVHAHGNPCDMITLEKLAKERGIALISDAAAAFGAKIGNRRIGSFGDMEVFSFSGTKVLTAGEGGVICCNNPEYVETIRCIGRYGIAKDYQCEMLGINGKMAELPAALALSQLPLLPSWQEQRMKAVGKYRSSLQGLRKLRFQEQFSAGVESTWKDFALILSNPEDARQLMSQLQAYRIESRPYYRPLHKMPLFSKYVRHSLPETERVADCVVCIPLYPEIRDEVILLVSSVVEEASRNWTK